MINPRRALTTAQNLFKDARGSFAVWFSLCLPVLCATTGAAIDFSNASSNHTRLQSALDAAVLASATTIAALPPGQQTLQATTMINNYLTSEFARNQAATPTVTATVDNSSGLVISATATSHLNTYVMGMFNESSINIQATSQVYAGGAAPTEVAIVFDTTYSMTAVSTNGLTKLANAQADAVSLVNALFTATGGGTNSNMKISLVPFGVYVNIGTQYAGQPWVTNTATVSGTDPNCGNVWSTAQTCVNTTWITATCYNDTVPYDCSYQGQSCTGGVLTYQCSPYNYSYLWYGAVGTTPSNGDLIETLTSANPAIGIIGYWSSSPLQRLTTDQASIISQINALTAQDVTYIAEGLVWGWRTLSPNSPFADGAAYGSAKKVLILMTDGYNTNEPDINNLPNNDWANDGAADTNLQSVCAAIQTAGITVYTIAFQVTDVNIKTILQGCSTTPANYFDAGNIASLSSAFGTIGSQIAGIHLRR